MHNVFLEQGTPEWLALRKTKITATDASVILGVNPWKTPGQLYLEKKSQDVKPLYINKAMQRGIDLEPLARSLFIIKTGMHVEPRVIVKDWAMASLDGICNDGKHLVEIKCAGEKDHESAIKGNVPKHYYPQLQHQMYVSDVQLAYYFSFDGVDGVIVEVKRDDEYIEKMITEEFIFYMCMEENTFPES